MQDDRNIEPNDESQDATSPSVASGASDAVITGSEDMFGSHSQELPKHEGSPFKRIAVIGLGLIGASICAAVKKGFDDCTIIGIDVDSRSRVVAMERGWVDMALEPADPKCRDAILDGCELVVLAVPVAAVDSYIAMLSEAGFAGVITDTISTKAHITQSADALLPHPQMFIPGHPMSGSEQSGIDAARSDLFSGINWILCPDESTSPEAFKELHDFIHGLGARVISIPREEHDRYIAIVSHVPHMVASALMQLASNHTDESQALMRLAAGGFKDTTRVAAGSPDLWTGIAFDNVEELSSGLGEVSQILLDYKAALEDSDRERFVDFLRQSASARRSLPAKWVPGSDKLLEVRIPMVNRNGVIAEVTTIASSVGCNIQSIDIDHLSEGNAVLSLILTDEGDIGQLSFQLINAGFAVSFCQVGS